MGFNVKEIITAWAISFNPDSRQGQLAKARLEICKDCPSAKHYIGVETCSDCGCPIKKKVFTDSYNPCPLGKWEDVDDSFFNAKKNKTLI